eukprot:10009087-Lingulodinium_polyedra.AAC.1
MHRHVVRGPAVPQAVQTRPQPLELQLLRALVELAPQLVVGEVPQCLVLAHVALQELERRLHAEDLGHAHHQRVVELVGFRRLAEFLGAQDEAPAAAGPAFHLRRRAQELEALQPEALGRPQVAAKHEQDCHCHQGPGPAEELARKAGHHQPGQRWPRHARRVPLPAQERPVGPREPEAQGPRKVRQRPAERREHLAALGRPVPHQEEVLQ